ncbi:MAG: citramalate synthase, partial [Nitrospinae bacterium]|nr:citramalate synthase [Nitrospinota bacterium]
MKNIKIYDTTLRDGSQAEEIAFTVEDKIRIAHQLDDNGIHYIEGGWPGSNPKDVEFFTKVKAASFQQARLVAFGSTRSPKNKADNDPNLKHLLEAETPVVTIFGKSWDMHVKEALSTNLDENLRMVSDSLTFLKKYTQEVMFDAEHFFDGYKKNPEYALKVLKEAESAGADWLVLCDTNGGTLPWEIKTIFEEVRKVCKTPLGIHTHNDSELGVANALTAVEAGAGQVQGTINGYGERCGNCNLVSVIPNLKLKMGMDCISNEHMRGLKELSAFVDELVNKAHWNHQPYVGKSAFAHKGGIHVAAVQKNRETYEHVDPSLVGNQTRILVSDLSGKSSIVQKAKEFGLDVDSKDPKIQEVLDQLKASEKIGYQYEGAEASFELLMRDALGEREQHFEFIGFRVIVEKRQEDEAPIAEATVKIRVNG